MRERETETERKRKRQGGRAWGRERVKIEKLRAR